MGLFLFISTFLSAADLPAVYTKGGAGPAWSLGAQYSGMCRLPWAQRRRRGQIFSAAGRAVRAISVFAAAGMAIGYA